MTWDNEIEQGRRVTYQNGKAHLDVTKAMKWKQEEIVESVLKKQKAAATATMMDQLSEQQKELLDSKSQLIRQYLLDNLVPILTDGLLDICKRQPTDPVDTLAEYMFKRSLDVPYKDPTTY
jgi:adenylate kinase